MTARRALAALLVSVVAAVGLAAAPASTAGAAPAVDASEPVSVVAAPDGAGVVRDGQDLRVAVTVTNTGTAALPSGRLTLSVDPAPSASTAALLAAIATSPEYPQGLATKTRGSVPALAASASRTVRLTVGHADLASILGSASGARVVYVQYAAGTAVKRIAQTAIVRMAKGSKATVGLAAVIPLVAPKNGTGLVDAATQEALVASDGAWGTALRAAQADPQAAVALDPEVLASIRLAGEAAAPAVSEFLGALRGLPNEFLRLPYADTDLTLARAAGAPTALDPTSFAGVAPATTAAAGATPAATPAPTATPPTAADLTEWNWSDRKVAWPVPGTTGRADLASFGSSSVLLASTDVGDTATRRASGPLARIGSTEVLVADPTVSSLLSAAGGSGVAADAALAELTGLLATSAVNGETSALLAAIPRGTTAPRIDEVLRRLGEQQWVRPTSLTGLGSADDAVPVQAKALSVPRSRVVTAKALVAGERDVQDLGKAVVTGAATVTAPNRLVLLAALSTAWQPDDTGWLAAARSAESTFGDVLQEVRLAKQSPPNFIGSDGKLPVPVSNGLAVPVRVVIRGTVSNGAVQFTDRTVEVIVPAKGTAQGTLPFKSIRNGRTDLTLSLTTPGGTPIGTPINRVATVSAGFDTLVLIGLLGALVVLLAVGVYRNVKRRRQPRAAAA